VAALAILSPAEPDLSLSPHHLDVAPRLLTDSHAVPEAAPEPLMMAQPVPHQTTDKRRVKVYELRHNDWFDRGTGFCFASFVAVCFSALAARLHPNLVLLSSTCTETPWSSNKH
jgi:protein phosphatase-4 regulatory subunit 3